MAVFCLGVGASVVAILWRELKRKDQHLLEIISANGPAMQAAALGMEKGSAATAALVMELRDVHTELAAVRREVGQLKAAIRSRK